MKKIIVVLLIVIVIIEASVMIFNDCYAGHLFSELSGVPLPDSTQILSYQYLAGKVLGNSNGIQFVVVLLLDTDASADEILARYHEQFPECRLEPYGSSQLSQMLGYEKEACHTNQYVLSLVIDEESPGHSRLPFGLLSLDIRAH